MTTVTQTQTILTPAIHETASITYSTTPDVAESPSEEHNEVKTSLTEGLWTIPTFEDKFAERQWAKEHMAGAFRFLAKMGYIDGAGGHISLRDPVRTDCFWINPYLVHFGMLNASDMILVDEDGQALTKTEHKVNRAGFLIHAALHKARPDIHAAVHTHSPYGRAWSVFGRPIEMLNQDACYFYDDLSVYDGFGGVVLGQEEGDRIAQALGPTNKNIILQNHGLMTCGGTVDEAVAYFHALEQACQAQILAESAAANGCQKKLIEDAEAAMTKRGVGNAAVMFSQFKPEYQMLLKETGGDFCQ